MVMVDKRHKEDPAVKVGITSQKQLQIVETKKASEKHKPK